VTTLFCDLETYSETPLKSGVHRYAETAEILLFSYAIDDGLVQVVDFTNPMTNRESLWRAIRSADELVFHKVAFDRTILRHYFPSVDWPIERFHCTHDRALAHSLPGSLEKLCDILGVAQDKRKLKTGKQLIQLFCKPRPKNQKLRRATRETHPAEWAQFIEYARLDIEAMREVYKKLPRWNYQGRELDLWRLDQTINDRGVYIDLDLVRAAIATVEREQARLATETHEATAGAVQSTTQRDALLAHILERYGVTLPDMKADTLERRLDDPDLPEPVKDLLRNRLQASSTTAAKYKRILAGVSSDGYLRGLLQFCGASRTGRWAGRMLQPQNLYRPPKHLKNQIDLGIEAIKAGGADLLFDNVMELVASCVRGAIVAPPGKKLVVSDLSNIEGRKAAWLAGELWKLQAFREYDAGIGPDMYKLAYAKPFACSPDEVDDFQRQIGKVMELMLQYEGGVGAFVTGAETYGIDLEDMAAKAIGTIPPDVFAEAEGFLAWLYEQAGTRLEGAKKRLPPTDEQKLATRLGLSERVFLVCDSLKRLWRRAHPRIVAIWADLADAACAAIRTPGTEYLVGSLKIRRDGNWLRIRLPSGRFLCYPSPRVDDSGQISYMGVNQYTRRWERLKTYGGKLFENITQAASRDVMAANMPVIEEHGYQIVLTVHDEVVTYALDVPGCNPEHLGRILARTPIWAPSLPLAASGYEAPRYQKD